MHAINCAAGTPSIARISNGGGISPENDALREIRNHFCRTGNQGIRRFRLAAQIIFLVAPGIIFGRIRIFTGKPAFRFCFGKQTE